MKINGNEKGDWSFPVPDEGDHIIQFIDVSVHHNENSGKDSLRINTQIVEGDCDGMAVAIFVPMFNKFGVKKLSDILVCAGIAEALEKRFPDDNVELWDEPVIDAINVLLPDKYAKITIAHGEYNGKANANVVAIERIKRKGSTALLPEPKEKEEVKREVRRPGRPAGSKREEPKGGGQRESEWDEAF